jgi:hypothetical protein
MQTISHPFWGEWADEFSPTDVVDRFVPNRIWNEIRNPTNQVLLGGVGTGKSIVLKRISLPGMLLKSEFLLNREFLGIYVDLKELRFLNSLDEFRADFSNSLQSNKEDITIIIERICDYACALSITKATLQTIEDSISR